MQRKKPSKLMWTQSWRRLNKKGKDENMSKKKSRKTIKVSRAIVGLALDDLKAKKAPVKKVVGTATEAALKEVKERSKAVAAKKKIVPKGVGQKGIIPKHQGSNFNARGGAKL